MLDTKCCWCTCSIQDGEIRRLFQRTLQKQGMSFKLGTKVNSAERKGDKVVLEVEPAKGGEKSTMEVDVVLVSAGRRPLRAQELGVCWV